jgi:hypothetical protein
MITMKESWMKTLATLMSIVVTGVLLAAGPGHAADTDQSYSIVVPVRTTSQPNVAWYEIMIVDGLAQEVSGFSASGDVIVHQASSASGPTDDWCSLLQQVAVDCDNCASVIARSGCTR